MVTESDVVIALSNSGETGEVLNILPSLRRIGAKIIAMVGKPDSTLGKNADVVLNVGVSKEACPLGLAPTSSTTAALAYGDALALALLKKHNFTASQFAIFHPGGSLGRRLLMTVGNVMHKEGLPVVAPDCSAKDMIHAVSKGGLGLIVICEGDKVLGIVTDGDIRRAMERRESEFFSIRAMDIATPNPKTIGPDEKLIAAEKKMTQHKINSLLVTDDQGKLVGVIQIYDIKL